MRRIALINQKGGVGKTTTTVNLGAALARAGRRVVVIDLDPQANLSLHLDVQLESGEPSTYAVLLGNCAFGAALRDSKTPGLRLLPSNIDLSGAELELANAFGRELILRDAIDTWEKEHREQHGEAPADYVLLDCPPSLGLLSINGLVAAFETVISVQTEFFALQGMTKLVDIVGLLRRRLNPRLEITGFLPCLYDNRTKLAREVIAELRSHFPGKVFTRAIAKNVKLAEAPSYGKTIFEYASESTGAQDYELVAAEVMAQEAAHAELLARFPAPPTSAPPRSAASISASSLSTSSTPPSRGAPAHKPMSHTPSNHKQSTRATESAAEAATTSATTLERPAVLAQIDLEPRSSVKSPPEHANDDELPELPPDAVLLEGAAD